MHDKYKFHQECNTTLEVDAKEAEVVRLIFKLATEGVSGEPFGIKKIATYLNENGHRNRGKEWRKQGIWQILSSSTYYGQYVFNRRDSRNNLYRPESEWITVQISAIISQEVFELASAQRDERSPGGRAHQSAGSPTLLSGLAKCSHCGASFVLMSGKGGRYSYYVCSTRLHKGVQRCKAPNIPKEELDEVVLKTVAEKVLNPQRIQTMLEEMRLKVSEMQKPDRDREKQLQRENALLTEQLNNWYQMIETNRVEYHKTLRDRLTATQQKIDSQTQELSAIARRRQIPLKKFGESQLLSFSEAFRSEILSPGSKFAKSYLKAVVSEIRISGDSGEISGRNADMAAAVSSLRPGAPLVVPRHVSNWRARRDSNS